MVRWIKHKLKYQFRALYLVPGEPEHWGQHKQWAQLALQRLPENSARNSRSYLLDNLAVSVNKFTLEAQLTLTHVRRFTLWNRSHFG
jgi:hypothetical protein